MSEKKHIDRIFQEKLKELNVSPGDKVWGKISQELGKKNKDRKVIPLWWKLAGVAASILLLLTLGNLIFNNKGQSKNSPVIVESETIEESNNSAKDDTLFNSELESNNANDNFKDPNRNTYELNNPVVNSNVSKKQDSNTNKKYSNSDPSISNSSLITNQSKVVEASIKETDNIIDPPKNSVLGQNKIHELTIEDKAEKDVVNQNIVVSETDNKTKAIGNKPEEIRNNNSLEELIVEKEKIPLTEEVIVSSKDFNEEEKESLNRWQVSPNFAPVYFNSFGDGSSIHDQLVYNKKNGEVNLSYGVNVSYVVNKRLSIKSGVNKLNLGYSTSDIIIYENLDASSSNSDLFRNIRLNNDVQTFSFVSGSNFGFVQRPSVIPGEEMAHLNQDMTFFEVPVELKYRLSDKKVGISLIGGFSTFFLSDNELSYELRGENTVLGEAVNLNNLSYSANFGFGLDFKFSKNMSFNLDPTFKYQINTFNNTSGNFKPYFIGVYSGINIKF